MKQIKMLRFHVASLNDIILSVSASDFYQQLFHIMAHEPTSMKSLASHHSHSLSFMFLGDNGERIEGCWWFDLSPLAPCNTLHT